MAAGGLKAHFLGWQCRIRQRAIREHGGRPSAGMRPCARDLEGRRLAQAISVVIVERDPEATTAQFRFICRKTHDPRRRYEEALRFLASAYYQQPRNFSDRLAAVFAADSALAARLLDLGRCRLEFEQFAQRYAIPCEVAELRASHPAYQAAFWHNKLFNAALPPGVRILCFRPDWSAAEAEPAP